MKFSSLSILTTVLASASVNAAPEPKEVKALRSNVLEKRDHYQMNFYSDSNCQNYMYSVAGDRDAVVGSDDWVFSGPSPKSFLPVQFGSSWVDSMNINNKPYFYNGLCSAGAPGLANFKYNVAIGTGQCFAINDLDATSCSIYFSVCDALGPDNIY
ncbi:hypothetical protein F5884DRAFT_855762 [Xylogone sp. PMI_703]|nr:hypothetical protein F5884DRAFT_855762 [Xylogone sp. PMI_703]